MYTKTARTPIGMVYQWMTYHEPLAQNVPKILKDPHPFFSWSIHYCALNIYSALILQHNLTDR
jgi:hypothetical protein